MSRPKRASGPALPEPVRRQASAFEIQSGDRWGIISDTHIPYHDKITINLFVEKARGEKVAGIILNGDICDFHALSRFDKTPGDPRYKDEVLMAREFLAWLRQKLPKARIIWKLGNHEERLWKYLANKAPELFDLDVLTLPALFALDQFGVEVVGDKKVIRLGRLHVIHGHEYPQGNNNPVNPARGLFLRAKSVALCGHFHQTSEHHEPTIAGKPQAAWSLGCACQLQPLYLPLNKWNHGFAFVDLARGGAFSVRNYRVLDGAVV